MKVCSKKKSKVKLKSMMHFSRCPSKTFKQNKSN